MKLSVCIPVYNVAPFIGKCAHSLFRQTYRDIEYVFVDDGSSDGSIAVMERVLAEYPERKASARVIRHPRNAGVSVARKTALENATGELLAFCDPDDWLDVGLYQAMVDRLVATGADVVLCSIMREWGDRSVLRACPADLRTDGCGALRDMDRIPGLLTFMTKVFRRTCVDGGVVEWPDELSIAEDFCFCAQVLARARLVVGIAGDCRYRYRANPNSLTRSGDLTRIVDGHRIVYDILSRRLPPDASSAVCRYLARMVLFWGVVGGALSKSDYLLWRRRLTDRDGRLDFSDRSPWGCRLMKVAERAFWLSRAIAPLVRRKVDDIL